MAEKRLLVELKQVSSTPPHTQNHQILELFPKDPDTSLFQWTAVIAKPTINDSPYYYNGQWTLDIEADSSYPIKPPKITFSRSTPINHPNINIDTGEICLDILHSDGWSPAWNLVSLVEAILVLLNDPEPNSPFNVDLANLFRHDKVAFESMAQFTIWKYLTLYESTKNTSGVRPGVAATYKLIDGDCELSKGECRDDERGSSHEEKDESSSLTDTQEAPVADAVAASDSSQLINVGPEAGTESSPADAAAESREPHSPPATSKSSSTVHVFHDRANAILLSPTVSESSSLATARLADQPDTITKRKSSRKRVSRLKDRVMNRISYLGDDSRRHPHGSWKDSEDSKPHS